MQFSILHAQSAPLAASLADALPAHRFVPLMPGQPWPSGADAADGIVTLSRLLDDEMLGRLTKLRWIQALTTGTDGFQAFRNLRGDVKITSARGIHGPAVSEMVFLQMLSLARDMPGLLQQQRERQWQRRPQRRLSGRTVVIVGTGVIASALAERCKAFGMVTIGISASPRPVDHFDRIMPRSALRDAATMADYFVVLTPLDSSTRGLISADVIDAMKASCFFVNVSRGGVCDEAALIAALEEGRLAGAALDVFDAEPLPEGHPLWTTKGVIVTPHLAGESDNYLDLVQPIIEHNVRCLDEGRADQMMNLVAART